MDQPSTEKKIIVDEDWKEQARREKEMLAEAFEQEKARQQAVPEKASFPLLVSSLATQALIALGQIEHPITRKKETRLEEARFHIDMLEVLEQKTQGNLSEDEKKMVEGLLFDLRMRFVELCRKQPPPAGS